MLSSIPPVVPIIVAALITNTQVIRGPLRRLGSSSRRNKKSDDDDDSNNNNSSGNVMEIVLSDLPLYLADFGVATVLWILLVLNGSKSITPWWAPITSLVSNVWPELITFAPQSMKHGGPLGPGCSKVCQVLSALVLWRLIYQTWPSLSIGTIPGDMFIWIGMIILTCLVNLVMHVWSYLLNTRGDHSGVHNMVKHTQGRSLHINEKLHILLLAMINGTCEEITSRYFWMAEFRMHISTTTSSTDTDNHNQYNHIANFAQAAMFGIWHYHGIPSGMTGVLLTFVYGGIMGLLYEYTNDGLLLPILAHGIADYYIFAIIARRQKNSSKM